MRSLELVVTYGSTFTDRQSTDMVAEVAANGDLIQRQTELAIDSLNAIIGVAAMLWFWWERRAPHFRLSFRGVR